MAELKLHVNVDRIGLDSLKKDIDALKKTKITLDIDTSGFKNLDKATKDSIKVLTDYNNSVNNVKIAELELKKAREQTLAAQNNAKAATENASRAYNDYRKSVNDVAKSENDLVRSENELQTSTNKLAAEQEKTARALNETGEATDKADKKMQGFISTFVKSAVIYQAIYAIRQAFMDALDTMKEVDSQLVTVRKVTGATAAEIEQIKSKAYATASAYGVNAADYLESVAQFARAGYKDMSGSLAELSTKTQIVGDTTAEVANQFLLSMDAAYQYEGSVEKLTRVLDGANEIDNNYATSIEKIAEGLGLIAPIASQVHVTEQELTSAIGTITAVTQRSGSEAARALRALFLNIIGDTKTEIEDGVTATEESVSALSQLLKRYAPDAVAAAEATGKIIDPMEAIAALSQSMKDGLLTEQELMEQLSSLGGKLRTSQLVALVSNFDMYQDMMQSYADSVGSADREVENALDSWERKTAILANTWTEFIQKSINTNFIKGFIDRLTDVIKLFGNLGNAIKVLGGYFVALKLPALIEQFKSWGQSLKNIFTGAGSITQYAQIAVAGVTTAFTAIMMAYNSHTEELAKAADEAKAKAAGAMDEAEKVQAAYTAYQDAQNAYDGSIKSKEALTTATNDLIEALGLEKGAVEDTADAYATATEDYIREQQRKINEAKQARILELENELENPFSERNAAEARRYIQSIYGDAIGKGSTARYGIFGTTPDLAEAESVTNDMTKSLQVLQLAYAKAKNAVKEFSEATDEEKKANAGLKEDYEDAMEFIGRYGTILDEIADDDTQIAELEQYIAGKRVEAAEKTSDGMQEAADNADKAAKFYHTLKEAVDEATKAIEDYQNKTSGEKTDAYSSYAGIYEDFLTDWEKGLKGSNKVNAAIDALLPDEVINDLRKKGQSAGELLASDFYKEIFTYIDEEGNRQFTKGEDYGSLLAYYLWDHDEISQYQEDGSKVIKLNDEIVATLSENEDGLSVSISDFDKLAEALYKLSGETLDPHAFAAFMDALGVFDEKTKYATDDLKKFADTVEALHGQDTINLNEFVQGEVKIGEDAKIIWDMVDALIEANEKGEIILDTDSQPIDAALESVEKLIGKRDEFGDEPFEADTDEAESDIDKLQKDASRWEDESPYVGVLKVDDQATSVLTNAISLAKEFEITARNATKSAQEAITNAQVMAATGGAKIGKSAVGTKNAPGGITLVNEQGPEVIQEGAYARIAGSGKPTLTWLQPGAAVYTASETKDILGGADPSLLYDGINAYAGGKATGVKRFQYQGGGSSAAAEAAAETPAATAAETTTSTGGGSSYTAPAATSVTSTAEAASTEKSSEKDEELERLKEIVSLRQAELNLIKAKKLSTEEEIAKQREIQQAIIAEKEHLEATGGDLKDIIDLETQWYNIAWDINEAEEELVKKKQEEELQKLEDTVDLNKSILSLQEAQGASTEELTETLHDIEDSLLAQIQYMEEIGASQVEINNLYVEYYNLKKQEQDLETERLSGIVSLNKSILSLQEAQGAEPKQLINTMTAIQDSLMDQIRYMESIGANQVEINNLYTEWYNICTDIKSQIQSMFNVLSTAIDNEMSSLEDQRSKELAQLDAQIEALNTQREARQNQLDLEEKILSVQKAELQVQNAMSDRTVRYYNAVSGQWEWGANAKNIKSAQDSLESARKALNDFNSNLAYQMAVASIEAQKEEVNKKYDTLKEAWEEVKKTLEPEIMSVQEALNYLSRNATPAMRNEMQRLKWALESLESTIGHMEFNVNVTVEGNSSLSDVTSDYQTVDINNADSTTTTMTGSSWTKSYDTGGVLKGIGGIKATSLNEMVVPPDITAKMLSADANGTFNQRMNELRYLYGVTPENQFAGITNNNTIGSQYNGDMYSFGNITLTRQQAEQTTVAELARLSRNLRLYSSAM